MKMASASCTLERRYKSSDKKICLNIETSKTFESVTYLEAKADVVLSGLVHTIQLGITYRAERLYAPSNDPIEEVNIMI